MSKSRFINEEELLKKALNVLIEKLGPLDTARFLSLKKGKRLDSVKRHREWQKNLDKEKFLKEIFE